MTSELEVTQCDRVVTLTLNRPERRNALNRTLLKTLTAEIERCSQAQDVWVVLITGAGERAFCSGVDLAELGPLDSTLDAPAMARDRARILFEAVLDCAKPVVVALNGTAVGAGLELALAADIRIAAEHARLGLPEAKRGLGATFGSLMLPRLIPRCLAYELLYTGEPIHAQQALAWGLINRTTRSEALRGEAESFCAALAANAPLSVQRYRAMIRAGIDLPIKEAMRLGVGPDPYTSSDSQEGVAAFLEKRPPRWSGT